MLRRRWAIGSIAGSIRDVLECDDAFDVLTREDGLFFPLHKYLDVRWHGDHGNWRHAASASSRTSRREAPGITRPMQKRPRRALGMLL